MKKIVLSIMLVGVFFLGLTGCGKTKETEKESESKLSTEEEFMMVTSTDSGRYVSFTISVPYKDTDLMSALLNNDISIDDLLKKLDYVEELKDGGSILYKYDATKKEFGSNNFFVLSCNSDDGIKDVFIAQYKKSLEGKCKLKIDDLEGVSMTIKSGTLTPSGATVIIKDTSNRGNIYGESYSLQKKEKDTWVNMEPIHDIGFNFIGYSVDKNNQLELGVNWEYPYGKLTNGTYRILKDTSYPGEGTEHYITAEFEIK